MIHGWKSILPKYRYDIVQVLKNKVVVIKLLLFLGMLHPLFAQERLYLSGTDAANAKSWDFMISTGRGSGYWTQLPVPSNWELHGFGYYTYGKDHEDYHRDPEVGHYRTTFHLGNTKGKRYRLTFEGVMTDTHVKINGEVAGPVHQGGFTQFHYEITSDVREGENTLEVEVRKSSANVSVQKSERNADYWLFGGIYRPVYIDILPMEYVERVAIDAKMDGALQAAIYLNGIKSATRLEARVVSSQGERIGKLIKVTVDRKDSMVTLSQKFTDVKPWSHEFPNLYRLEVELKEAGKIVHSYTQAFGFRTFEVRDHDGFYLNGKRVLLKGANMHSFRPASGRALSRRDIEDNFHLLKALNFNSVRPCHYPPDAHFFELCDSLGLLAMDELPGWHAPLETGIGKKLVEELVVRDVNHPSIILWGNGNHRSHNPALDPYFFQWDIQKRRPLKNAAKKEKIFDNYTPPFDIVDTRFYPAYDELVDRLNGKHIILPNEALHALYDGGGAAGLKDYWRALKSSKVGGGLMIWSLFDECVVRTDHGYQLDCMQNKAPDGIVGPNGEKEASYYAVKEIWSPVQVETETIDDDFNGVIEVSNDFTFVNLSQCRFESNLLHFARPNEAGTGYRAHRVSVVVDDIPAGESGAVRINLPKDWKNYDALQLKAWDNHGREIHTWAWPITMGLDLASQFVGILEKELIQHPNDPFLIKAGDTHFKFNATTAALEQVITGNKKFPIGATPVLVYRSENDSSQIHPSQGKVTVRQEDQFMIIEGHDVNGFDRLTWTVMPQGYLKLDYAYTLPKGEYHYAGVGLRLQNEDILRKRWLGEGPERIWKNRVEGGVLNVWDRSKQWNVPGKVYNPPSFEGCFAPWYWGVFHLAGGHTFGLSAVSDGLVLGVSNPRNGEDPKFATWQYPRQEGIYVFNYISPVGAKWRQAEEFGPSSQLNFIDGTCRGTINLYFDWNKADKGMQEFQVEIE